mmetsp:Transcript_21299/g.49310  ORF Transcript_21299/g.49310 Transcript_21299/m.49310 type:complete len:916 (+) Transcript_21299:701-3448(+)
MLYCVKITWAVESTGPSEADNESVFSGGGATVLALPGDDNDDANASQHDQVAPEEPKKKKRGIFRKGKSKSASQQHITKSRSRDEPSTPNSSVVLRSPSSKKGQVSLRGVDGEPSRLRQIPTLSSSADNDDVPKIPAIVEVEDDGHEIPTPKQDDDTTLTTTNRFVSNNQAAAMDGETESQMEQLHSKFLSVEKQNKKKAKQKIADGAKYAAVTGAAVGVAVVTVGIGLVAGLAAVAVGTAAGGSTMAAVPLWKKKRDGVIVIGSTDYDTMRSWKACLDAALNSGIIQKSKWGQQFVGDGNRKALIFPKGNDPFQNREVNVGSPPPSPDAGSAAGIFFESTAKWKPLDGGWATFLGTGTQGLRILREERPECEGSLHRKVLRSLSVDVKLCSPMKSHIVLNATPLDAFLCLMSHGQIPGNGVAGLLAPNSGQRSSFRVIESIDDNTDVIHLICTPLYLFPSWTTPRDFVLYRYWRLEEDGSFVVCYESVEHKDCPPHPSLCRGEMHQVYTVAPSKKVPPRRKGASKDLVHECLMTAVVQVDPRGWVPIAPIQFFSNQGYGDAFTVASLMHLLDIRDAIDQDRFIPVSLDEMPKHGLTRSSSVDHRLADNIPHVDSMNSDEPSYQEDYNNYDYSFADREAIRAADSPTGLSCNPPCLPLTAWAEPDANSFRVRGKAYKVDRQKINAGASIGRLVAVDVVNVEAPIYSGFSVHPTERVQLALQKEKLLKDPSESDMPPFMFIVNIVLPGPPFYHGVFYYAIDDMSTVDGSSGTPSSKLCKQFFFGDSDSFRDRTFKLIPQIVEGNFIVRKAVGSTPAIMGKKLRQTYVRTDRTFEVVLDCGSSPVATGVIRLSLGYAKTLVVDMAFLFEGDEEDHLPEKLMGCARIRNLEFGPSTTRTVKAPPEPETPVSSSSTDVS